jgi:hypothetical protein
MTKTERKWREKTVPDPVYLLIKYVMEGLISTIFVLNEPDGSSQCFPFIQQQSRAGLDAPLVARSVNYRQICDFLLAGR